MKVYFRLKNRKKFTFPVVALGTFDGLHLGHQKVIGTAVEIAKFCHGTSIVLTFDHIPREVLKKNVSGVLLTTLKEKVELIKKLGAQVALVLKFDQRLAAMGATDFVKKVLVAKLKVKILVVGENYRFGSGRSGDVSHLRILGEQFGFQVRVVPTKFKGEYKISSTRIRDLLKAGQIKKANTLLGRYFSLSGKVVKGRQIGTKIEFPTANLQVDRRVLLPLGVFATRAFLSGKKYKAVVNIGQRPTILGAKSKSTKVEAHFLGFHKMIYGKLVRLELVTKIRDEKVFKDTFSLRTQIAKDVSRADAILAKENLVSKHSEGNF